MESQIDRFVQTSRGPSPLVWLIGPRGDERVYTYQEYTRLDVDTVGDATVYLDGIVARAVAARRRRAS